ncbi:hypothetical protein SNOG_16031 [Parastagonospora nodorum SN15]|uniref:Uncharacterized protein n=1 Tax=Phaeosphaeria nodorum (strain SN15 / ATCC MYA-4574 / FGSC 10173) TaxID=321614 RepID=Q0TWV8_PHANO|nr:hypothetical protein SNOG_16031 [Parastagonospora nodorum SN15]EAT76610.2 hypothetical protein SNOG_16031 [Parastagonospora nodorum SN15]
MQQKASQGQQQARNPYVDSIPQLSLWTFEKPSQSSTWDGVKPRKEYVSQEEIQEKLARLKRDDETVTDRLDATKSRSCRAEIRNFVEDQNAKLKKENKLGEYIIAGMMLSDHRQGRKDKQKYPHRVQVILQIEETSLPNVPNSRLNTSGLGTAHGAQDFNKPMKANNPLGPQGQGSLQNQGLNMNQQQRPVQQQGQHGMGGQHFEQRPPPPHGQVPMHHDDDWDTETSSGSEQWQTRSVSDDFAYVEDRGRGRSKPIKHGKQHVHKSRSPTMPQMPGMPSRAYGYAQQPQDYLNGNNMYASQPQHYMPTNIPVNPDRFTLEELRLKLDQLKLDEQRTLFGPGRDTFEDFTTLRNQLNNAEQRARLGQNRYTLDEFREMFNERGQRAPLGRGQNDRVDPGLYYDRADPRMAQRQGEQRRPAFLDDEYSDPRYAGRGAAYDPFRV